MVGLVASSSDVLDVVTGLVVGDTDVCGRNAGLSLSIETVSFRPFFLMMKYFRWRSWTSNGPSYGGCSGGLLESTRTNTYGVVAKSFGM